MRLFTLSRQMTFTLTKLKIMFFMVRKIFFQTIKTREICSYDIEYSDDEDPDIVMTEIRQCAYREYESVKHELESMECESSSQQYVKNHLYYIKSTESKHTWIHGVVSDVCYRIIMKRRLGSSRITIVQCWKNYR